MSRDMFPCVQGFKDMFTIGYPPEIPKVQARRISTMRAS